MASPGLVNSVLSNPRSNLPSPIPEGGATPDTPGRVTELAEKAKDGAAASNRHLHGELRTLAETHSLMKPHSLASYSEALTKQYSSVPSCPMKIGIEHQSALEFLCSWTNSSPEDWPKENRYFQVSSTEKGVSWQVNNEVLEWLVVGIQKLCHVLNAVCNQVGPLTGTMCYDPDPENNCLQHLKGQHTLLAVEFADRLYKARVEKGLEHVKMLIECLHANKETHSFSLLVSTQAMDPNVHATNRPDACLAPTPHPELQVADCNVPKHTTGNKHIDSSDSDSAVGMTTKAPSGVSEPLTAAAAQLIGCNNVSLATQCANNCSNMCGSPVLNLEAGRQGPVR